LKQSHNSRNKMKKSKAKSKIGHGGARAGAGRPRRWKHGPLKMVRLPVAFVEEILEVAQYMDQNDGRLPFSEASEDLIIISGHPSESLSGEELKELAAKRKAQKLAKKVMAGDEELLVSDGTFKELYELPDSLWGEG
jgi:hypothetical protein